MAGSRAGAGPVRAVLVVGLALLVAVHLLRSAAVALPFAERPSWASVLWPDHPRILTDTGMAAIGAAAARGQDAPPAALAAMMRVARKQPLEAMPFLVHGAVAQLEGRDSQAAASFAHARRLEPRARAARYFLADHYLRTGEVAAGLTEMGVLARLTPRSRDALVPALTAYAKTPGAVGPLTAFLRDFPELTPFVLDTLAQDPTNADLVVGLAGPGPYPREAATGWQAVLLRKLVDDGQYAKAHVLWRRLAGAPPGQLLFNPGFRDLAAPPPFNWTFLSGAGGVAEPAPDNRLQIIYYGRENAGLAQQLLLLSPGRYDLAFSAAGDAGSGGVRWSLRCLPDDRPILELPVKPGANAGSFVIPASGCPAQWLDLRGVAADPPRPAELSLSALRLTRRGG